MVSNHETFWDHRSFAVVGNAAKKNFPVLTYRGLKSRGKIVYAVDPSSERVEGDRTFAALDELPERVEAVVLEVPSEETREWVARAADAGIRDVWIHMHRETPEAVALAKGKGLNVHTGHCAVMYLNRGFDIHAIHRWIVKATGKY